MSAPPLKVLVVDDEPPIRKLLRMGLGTQGYHIIDAPNAKAALDLMADEPDLVILDLGLPDMQGLELLRQIRQRREDLPIVVLSSRGDEVAKVEALDLGADDYVTKPFGMEELLARIRAALRHQLQVQGERPVFKLGDLSVDLVRRIVKLGGEEVKLSPKEYELLRVMVQHAGKVLTHKFLLNQLWSTPIDPQYLRVYVRQLRSKIEPDPARPHYILTETGIGYRLKGPRLEPPMKISDFLSPAHVMLDVRASDKRSSSASAFDAGCRRGRTGCCRCLEADRQARGARIDRCWQRRRASARETQRAQVAVRSLGSAAPRHRL